jgi:hypothetical protein
MEVVFSVHQAERGRQTRPEQGKASQVSDISVSEDLGLKALRRRWQGRESQAMRDTVAESVMHEHASFHG